MASRSREVESVADPPREEERRKIIFLNDDNIRKKCTIEEFAIFFLNLVRNQTDDFQRGNTSSQCDTPIKTQSECLFDDENNAQQVTQTRSAIIQSQQRNQISNLSLPHQSPSLPSLAKLDLKNSTRPIPTSTISSILTKENLTKNKLSKSLSNSALISEHCITSPTIIKQKEEENLSQTGEQLFSSVAGNNKSLDSSSWHQQYKKNNLNNSLTNDPILFDQNTFNDSLQLKSSSPINQQKKNLKKSIQFHRDNDNSITNNVPGIIHLSNQQTPSTQQNEDLFISCGRYPTPNRSFENHYKSNTSTPVRKFNRSNDNNISTVSNISNPGGNGGGVSGNKNRNTSFCLGDFILPSSSSSSSPSSNQSRQKNRNNKNSKDVQSTSNTILSTPSTITESHNRNTNNIGLSHELTVGKSPSTNKPKKRVQPTQVIPTNDGLSSSSVFTSPAFRMENNILNISKEEILDKSNCQILKERVKLKTEKNAIAKEFESESIADKQNYLHLKYIQENLTTNPVIPLTKNISSSSLHKCQSIGDIVTTSTAPNRIKGNIDFTKITNRHALNRFIEIHSALIELNLTTNILNEMSYLLNFLNYTDFDDFTISNIAVTTDAILPIELKKISDSGDDDGGNFTMTNLSSSSVHNSKIQNSTTKEKQVSSVVDGEIKNEIISVDINSEVIVDDTQIDPKLINHIDDSICNFTSCDKLYTILKNFLNCLYYARGVLDKQKHLLALLDVTTLRVVLDNEHLDSFNKDLKLFLNNVYQRKLQLDNMISNHETSFKICSSVQQTVFYQQENDTKNNFPSEREFLAFKKQRDMFYIILKIWETKHLNHTWNFHIELGPKIHSLLNVMENPINMAHLAKLFTSQLILSSNFSAPPSDLDIILPNIDLSKLSKLRQRLVAPSNFSVDYQFPGNQAFFKDFLLTANSVVFSEQLKIVIIAELIEMNNSSYEVINLSNDNMEVDKINNDVGDDDNQRYNEYVVRPEIISTMRVLSKFLGLLMSRPFNYQGNRNSVVDNRQIELRDLLQPEFDLIKILEKSIIDRKLIVTIPWLVQYLSMLDHITLKLSYYRQLIQKLYQLYMNMKFYVNSEMRPTSIFILRTCLGWLFDNLNISEGYYQYRQQIFSSADRKFKLNIISGNINDTKESVKLFKKQPLISLKDNDKIHQILIYAPSNLRNEFKNDNNEKILMTDLRKHDNNNEYYCKLVKTASVNLTKNNNNSTGDDGIDDFGFRNFIAKESSTSNTEDLLIHSDRNIVNRGHHQNNIISINKSFDPLLESILNVSCPFLADFRVAIMPMKSSKCVSRTGRYRHITTKLALESPSSTGSIAINNTDSITDVNKMSVKQFKQNSEDTHTKLIEAFLHSQSLSVRRIVEFVIERTTSAVIKDYQMEILLPSKTYAMDKINEINSIELKTIINEMYKIFSDIYNDILLKWDKEIPKMIEDRVKKALDALLPNETLEAVKKTCLDIITKKCQLKANDWRLANLNGLEFYSKDIQLDAEKLFKNNTLRKTEQLIMPATILEIDMSKPKMSIVFSKLQFSLHCTNLRPEFVNEPDLLKLCDELYITLNSHKLPTSFFRVTGVMTVCLVQNLILRHQNILTNNLIEKLIKLWLCDGLKIFIQLPNLENDENKIDEKIVTNSEENITDNFEDITFDSMNIFNGILSASYLQLILHNSESYEQYSEILVILLKYKLLNMNYLNNKLLKLFKHDWTQDEYKKLTIILENITQKTQQIQSNENDSKSILFMEMLTDLITDLDEF